MYNYTDEKCIKKKDDYLGSVWIDGEADWDDGRAGTGCLRFYDDEDCGGDIMATWRFWQNSEWPLSVLAESKRDLVCSII